MSTLRQIVLVGLISALSGQVKAAQPCPNGPLSATAKQLSDYSPAQAYCTALFPLTTTTISRNAPTTTISNTVTTITKTVNGGAVTITSTANPVSLTSTKTVKNTVSDPLNTVTLVLTPTSTQTSFTGTITTTVITTQARGAKRAREAEPTPEVLNARQAGGDAQLFQSVIARPTAQQQVICRCLEVRPRTTVVNTPTIRVPVTATSTVGGDATQTLTVTPTVTTTSTTSLTITTTRTTISTDLATTVTTTLSTILTKTATITIPSNGPDCLPNGDYFTPGTGGCSAGCLCDLRKSDSSGFCNNGLIPAQNANGVTCTTDADCAVGSTCASDSSLMNPAGTCVDFTGCLTTYDAATGTFPAKGPVANFRTFPVAGARMGRMSSKKKQH